MSALQGLYRGIFRRTSTFALVFCTGGLVYAMYLDKALDTMFRNLNKGVGLLFPNDFPNL